MRSNAASGAGSPNWRGGTRRWWPRRAEYKRRPAYDTQTGRGLIRVKRDGYDAAVVCGGWTPGERPQTVIRSNHHGAGELPAGRHDSSGEFVWLSDGGRLGRTGSGNRSEEHTSEL